jgi:hypothetical protein
MYNENKIGTNGMAKVAMRGGFQKIKDNQINKAKSIAKGRTRISAVF